jgi:hypothetical protein
MLVVVVLVGGLTLAQQPVQVERVVAGMEMLGLLDQMVEQTLAAVVEVVRPV